jgi:hypothetical protein
MEELREAPLEVEQFTARSGRKAWRITTIPKAVTAGKLELLDGIDIAYVSLEAGEAKPKIATTRCFTTAPRPHNSSQLASDNAGKGALCCDDEEFTP